MTQPKREKLISSSKDTRWDRIRKRHCNNISTNLKTETLKKLIETDYIGRHQQKLLNGNNQSEKNLDPVLVMNLRHEMFKKIPHKLPLATIAYSNNLQQCKEHNVAVEDHYIENQLNQFRKHLQKQRGKNKFPSRKIPSMLIDNTDILNSLKYTHEHIKDFYNAPIDALNKVQDLFTEEIEKHSISLEHENLNENKIIELENKDLLDRLEKNEICDINEEDKCVQWDTKSENQFEENEINFMAERIHELNLNNGIFDSELKPLENIQRTPSPLENTDEILKPLRQVIEDTTLAHLKFVKFDDDCKAAHLQREASISSNTSDGIDSVISDLAEEALKELQMEEENKSIGSLEKHYVKINDCCHELTKVTNANLTPPGKIALYEQSSTKEQNAKSFYLKSTGKTGNNTEQSIIVNDLLQPQVSHRSLMRKYFLKWVHYTSIEKIEREHVDIRANRVKKINIFLNKIRIEKKRLKNCQSEESTSGLNKDCKKSEQKKGSIENIKINKKYQNKIKVQQDIIDLQRLKLERQERMIMELKLHKLSEESKEARQELKNELKSVIRSGDPKSKAKAKCLQLIGNLKDEEDDQLSKLQGKSLLMPKFLQNMHERALERDIRHQQAKQRRLQQEAEREAHKLALEEAKRLEDEEAKRFRIEALKEKRRQEKMAKIIREREHQKYLENQQKAQYFYKRLLLKRIGMEGFKRLLKRKMDNIKKCEQLRQSLYKKTYFQAWFSLYRINKARRNQKADELYEKCLKRKYINIWLQYIYEERSKLNVAIDYHEFKLTENMFQKWWTYFKRMKIIEQTKMKQAVSHHEWHLKWKVLDCWRRLPQILQLEKETEERRQRWRLKIWELLPDYTPNRDDFNCM